MNKLAYSVDETAKALGISATKVRELAKKGELPSKRYQGRIIFPVKALEKKINEGLV